MTDVQDKLPNQARGKRRRCCKLRGFVGAASGTGDTAADDLLGGAIQHSLHTGDLSSSPLLWPSFKSALTIQRLCLYLKVVRASDCAPEKAKNKILTVGQDMNLVPKHKVRTYDLASERLEKHGCHRAPNLRLFSKG